MENCTPNKEDSMEAILAFDAIYTTNHMKILKLLYPYLESEHQKKIAIFIKWQELLFTLKFLSKHSISLYHNNFKEKKELNPTALLPLLTPYCSEKEKNILSQFMKLYNMMDMLEDFNQYIPMIQQFMNLTSNTETSEGYDIGTIMDLFKNMMSEEQMGMFSAFMESMF